MKNQPNSRSRISRWHSVGFSKAIVLTVAFMAISGIAVSAGHGSPLPADTSVKPVATKPIPTTVATTAASTTSSLSAVTVGASSVLNPIPEQQDNHYTPIIRVWVHPNSIRPDIIHARPGRIALWAQNETVGDVSIVVERINQARSAATSTTASKPIKFGVRQHAKRAKQEIELSTGEYVFYEESQPQLRGRLIVDNQ